MIITDATRGCAWRPTSIAARSCAHASEADIMDCRAAYNDPPYLRTLAASPAWAPAAVELCERGALRAARFGPFTSTPQRGWRSLISGELKGLLRSGDRIVASASQPVAADGAPIGFPPLHNHHVHVRKGERGVDRAVNNHWFESHGDYPTAGAASTAGYTVALPAGYCVVVGGDADDIDVEAEVNDVRAAGAPPLVWYLQVAFRLAEAPCRPASKVWLRYPWSRALTDDWWNRYAVPNAPALSWWSGELERDGALLGAWLHSHRSRFADVLLLRGTPADLGFRCDQSWGIAAPPHADADYALARNLSRTRARLAATGSVVCRSDAAVPTAARVDGEWYDRRGAIACVPWSYRAGDAYTVVALHEPRWRPEERVTPQHTELWLWVDEGARDSRVALPDFFTATAMDCGGEAVAGGLDLGGTPLVESAASLLQAAEGGGNLSSEGGGNLSYESYSEYGRYYSDPDKADGSYEYQSYEYGAEDEVPPAAAGLGWRPSQPGGRPSIGPQPLDLGIAGAVMAVAAAGAMLWTRLRRAAYESIGDGSVAAARESEALELANTFRSP